MKTLLMAALAAALATSALASPLDIAVKHFNQDRTGNALIVMPASDASDGAAPTVSARGATTAQDAISRFNLDRTGNDMIPSERLTSWLGTPLHGAALHEALRAEE